MSKKRFVLLALVVAFVLAMAGSAFAAPEETSWEGSDGGVWDSESSWSSGIPSADTLAVFPNTTKGVKISGKANAAGAIRIDSGSAVTFTMDPNSELTITGFASADGEPKSNAGIWAQGDALFTGGGVLIVSEDHAGTDVGAFQFSVAEGKMLELGVVVSSDSGITTLRKEGKGTLKFSANQSNRFASGNAFVIQDGEVQITRQGHINTDVNLYFDTNDIQGRTATLTSLWTNTQGWNTASKLFLSSDGTLNVPAGTFRFQDATVVDVKGNTLTKSGAGTLLLNKTFVVSGDRTGATLNISEGSVNIGATDALLSNDINVAVAEGASFLLDKNLTQHVRAVSGLGTLDLAEQSDFAITANSTFPGYITGYGNVRIGNGASAIAVSLTGTKNDYIGDTLVKKGSKLTINHANNLGGTKGGKLYLEPSMDVVTHANYGDFTLLAIDEKFSGIMPNEIQIASHDVANPTMGGKNVGAVVIDVPQNSRFEIANNIRFNENTIAKAGQGEIVFSSAGYGSIGNGSFTSGQAGSVSVALHIINGVAEIRSAYALDQGDIVVDAGGYPSGRPVLRLLNGLVLDNSIFFTDNSTFQTTLKEVNLNASDTIKGTPAVTVDRVFYNDVYNGNKSNSSTTTSGRVYNRIGFEQLPGATVTLGQQFYLLKSTRIDAYGAANIMPVRDDAQQKALFNPFVSNNDVTFTATSNIDVPTIGTPTATGWKVGTPYNFSIPVTSKTGVLAATIDALPGMTSATPSSDGTSVLVAGVAPATSQDVTYRLTVTTNGEVPDTAGYENYADFRMSFNDTGAGSTPGGEVPKEPTLTAAAMTVDEAAPEKGETVTFTLGSWTFTDAAGAATTYEWNDAAVTYTAATVTGEGAFVSETAQADLIAKTANTIAVKVNDDAAADSTITLTVNATVNGLTGTMTGTAKTPAATTPLPSTSSSSGCDAGFGAFALLAAAGALVLRKKD